MTSLALLDLDGTLTDSAPGIVASLRAALTEAGLPVPDDATLRTFVGPPLPESLARAGVPAERVDELITVYRRHFAGGGMFDNAVYPGIPEALGRLQDAGVRLAVATSKPEVYARQIVAHFGLDRYLTGAADRGVPGVENVFGAGADRGPRSSKAAVIGHALDTLAERAAVGAGAPVPAVAEIRMVGDRFYDVAGAREQGIATVGVAWGYGLPGELEGAGAIAVAPTPADLPTLLLTT